MDRALFLLLAVPLCALPGCPPTLGGDDDDRSDDDDATGDDDDVANDDDATSDDDDVTGDDDDTGIDCAAAPTDANFFLCPDDLDFPWGERIQGRFTSWEEPLAAFTASDGRSFTFSLELGGAAREFPSPAAWPLLSFRLDGQCPSRAAWSVLTYYTPDDDLIGAIGNALPFELEGAQILQQDSGCAAATQPWCGCAERCRVDELVIQTENEIGWRIPQGQVLNDGALHFAAWSMHTRQSLLCADVSETSTLWGIWVDVAPPPDPTPTPG